MVERHITATADVAGRNVEPQFLHKLVQSHDGLHLLRASDLDHIRSGHVVRRINQSVVSFADDINRKSQCSFVALQPFAETDEALNAIAGVSFRVPLN